MPSGIYKRTSYHRERISTGLMGHRGWNKGLKQSEKEIERKRNHRNSVETRRKISTAHKKSGINPPHGKGEKAPNWRGGITPVNKLLRTSNEYKVWRKTVFERDNYTCVLCGQLGGELHADHIKPFSQFEQLRFVVKNGRTLCKKCHRLTPTFAGRSIKKNVLN